GLEKTLIAMKLFLPPQVCLLPYLFQRFLVSCCFGSVMTTSLTVKFALFGVRALPKRQMILKLKEIFQFTHQQAGTDSKKKSMPGAALPANRLTDGEGNGDLILTTSEASAGTTGAGSETYAASQSSSTECKISMLAEKEENVLASQIAASGEDQKLEILKHYIHSNPSLCQQILLYQPIKLSALHAELKQNGMRIALDKLLDFLDTSGITFTTAEARREKKHHLHRCKKKGQR
uniref:Structure-specific endonuclease subunit SLX4 n=1 Tax=Naja naja TaxID=35670 RepID=A0A8C7DX70_NAJNA